MYFRACRKVSCGCCSLGFVVGGTFTALLVLHVMDSYTAKTEEVSHFALLEDIHCDGKYFIGGKTVATPEECAGICEATEGCMAFVYDKRRVNPNNCWCKNICKKFPTRKNIDTYIKAMNHIGCSVFGGKRSCYHLSQSVGNFDEMTNYCTEHNMQMAVLETWEEFTFISNKIKRDNMAINIHVSLKLVSGHYIWIYPEGDTVQLNYGKQKPWDAYQPSYIGNQDCVYFRAIQLGKLDDFYCSRDRFTICE